MRIERIERGTSDGDGAESSAPRLCSCVGLCGAVWGSALVRLPFFFLFPPSFLLFRPFPTIGRTTNNAATTLSDASTTHPLPHYLLHHHSTLGDAGKAGDEERRHLHGLHGLSPLFVSLHPTSPPLYDVIIRRARDPLHSKQRATRNNGLHTSYTRAALRSSLVELGFSGLSPTQTRFGYMYKQTQIL